MFLKDWKSNKKYFEEKDNFETLRPIRLYFIS